MASLKNITDLPVAESADGLNLIVNDNGAAKQIAASAIEGKVKTINGVEPDESGDVQIDTASSWNDLKDKPFYSEMVLIEILNNTLHYDGYEDWYMSGFMIDNNSVPPRVGDTYIVQINNGASQEYVLDESMTATYTDVTTGKDYDLNFGVEWVGGIVITAADRTTDPIVVKVIKATEKVHKLDSKYLYDIVIELEEDYKNATGSLPITTEALYGDYYQAKEKLLAGDIVRVCVKHRLIKTGYEFVAVCPAIWVGYVKNYEGGGEFISIDWIEDGELRNLAFTGNGIL